jgi:hypothetical protein
MRKKIFILLILSFAFVTLSATIAVQSWGVAQRHNAGNIVIYRGQAYLAMQNIQDGTAPSQSNSDWRLIAHYSNPGRFRYDSAYVAGDIVRHNNEVFVARRWTNNTAPNRNDLSGAWILVNNHAPISGPIAKLPPHPGRRGRETILGIDSDGDGVRDDIQIEITRLIPDDPHKRAGAMFAARMHQEFLTVFLRDTTQTFEQLQPYFDGKMAGSHYWVRNRVFEIISNAKYAALLYNTRERFLIRQKISSIMHGNAFLGFRSLPIDVQEKYKETYEREKERQR